MIKIKHKEDCNGCSACINICPVGCIDMVEDHEGFLYPHVNEESCINCGLCEKICPILNYTLEPVISKKVVAGFNKNDDIQKSSSSGGIFYELAKNIIEKDGIVFGALYDSNLDVFHGYINKIEDIKKLQGSKYVQSDLRDSFKQVKTMLNQNQFVLFSGTPCQVASLKQFLGKKHKKLITCDFICTGVPSPKIHRAYIDYYQEKYKDKIQDVEFRNKKNGWKNFGKLYKFKNKIKYINRYNDPYINAHFSHLILRPGCYNCKFKELNSTCDIKLGDFWQIKQIHPKFYDYNGVSIIMVNSETGLKIYNEIKDNLVIKESNYDEISRSNRALNTLSTRTKNRDKFFKEIEKLSNKEIIEILKKYTKKSVKLNIHDNLFVLFSNIKYSILKSNQSK